MRAHGCERTSIDLMVVSLVPVSSCRNTRPKHLGDHHASQFVRAAHIRNLCNFKIMANSSRTARERKRRHGANMNSCYLKMKSSHTVNLHTAPRTNASKCHN